VFEQALRNAQFCQRVVCLLVGKPADGIGDQNIAQLLRGYINIVIAPVGFGGFNGLGIPIGFDVIYRIPRLGISEVICRLSAELVVQTFIGIVTVSQIAFGGL